MSRACPGARRRGRAGDRGALRAAGGGRARGGGRDRGPGRACACRHRARAGPAPEVHPGEDPGPRHPRLRRGLRRGAGGVPRCALRRRRLHQLHRAQSQLRGAGALRLPDACHLCGGARAGRPLGDGDAADAARHRRLGQGVGRREALPDRAERHRHALQPLWAGCPPEQRQRALLLQPSGPAPPRAARRCLHARLCRAGGALRGRGAGARRALRCARHGLPQDRTPAALVRRFGGTGRAAALSHRVGAGGGEGGGNSQCHERRCDPRAGARL